MNVSRMLCLPSMIEYCQRGELERGDPPQCNILVTADKFEKIGQQMPTVSMFAIWYRGRVAVHDDMVAPVLADDEQHIWDNAAHIAMLFVRLQYLASSEADGKNDKLIKDARCCLTEYKDALGSLLFKWQARSTLDGESSTLNAGTVKALLSICDVAITRSPEPPRGVSALPQDEHTGDVTTDLPSTRAIQQPWENSW
ncbi:uncharacterized protein B0H18DRAFT_1127772 [Fomitopsis serialis]|uniref:uncharacterized protein n=1 Tax=Fomitopsis serialis TaxID=139415 RepID=UPI002007B9D8|nr:uncharacterized protein B0H18DRAFT_1127772 [Neoantrodia serialis]KAH9911998.1 hypothetical protein B0H18DRAFT_1127772 [Neoantrodia serialis]